MRRGTHAELGQLSSDGGEDANHRIHTGVNGNAGMVAPNLRAGQVGSDICKHGLGLGGTTQPRTSAARSRERSRVAAEELQEPMYAVQKILPGKAATFRPYHQDGSVGGST
jgi:hypothetical protein